MTNKLLLVDFEKVQQVASVASMKCNGIEDLHLSITLDFTAFHRGYSAVGALN